MTNFLEIIKDLQDRITKLEQSTALRSLAFPSTGKITVPNASAAPSGQGNGSMYYNTSDNKFYVFENGVWRQA